MEQRTPRLPKLAWVKTEEEYPETDLELHTEELVPIQLLQEGTFPWTEPNTDGEIIEQRPPRVPKLAWVGEEEEESEPDPEVETEEVVQIPLLPEEWKRDGKDMEQRPPRVPKVAWVEEEEEEPEPDPEVETEEVVQIQLPQNDTTGGKENWERLRRLRNLHQAQHPVRRTLQLRTTPKNMEKSRHSGAHWKQSE